MKMIGRKTVKPAKTSAPMVSKASKDSAKAQPTYEEIAKRSYELYLARGGEPGNAEADWLQAEAELKS
jgi:hypothetical protein